MTRFNLILAGWLISPAIIAAPLTFDTYLSAVETHSLELQAQQQDITSAKAGIGIAGLRPDPELTLGAARETPRSIERRPITWTPAIGMAIETGGKRAARLKAARSNVTLAEETVAGFKSELYATAAAAYTEACRTREVLARKEHTMAALSKVVEANVVRRKAGDVGGIELLQSRVERDQFQAELAQARSEAQGAMLELSPPLGRQLDALFPEAQLACDFTAFAGGESGTLVLRTAQERLARYRDGVLLDAQKVVDGIGLSYFSGNASLLEWLAAQHSADDAWQGYLQARADVAIASTQLQLAIGQRPRL